MEPHFNTQCRPASDPLVILNTNPNINFNAESVWLNAVITSLKWGVLYVPAINQNTAFNLTREKHRPTTGEKHRPTTQENHTREGNRKSNFPVRCNIVGWCKQGHFECVCVCVMLRYTESVLLELGLLHQKPVTSCASLQSLCMCLKLCRVIWITWNTVTSLRGLYW